VDGNGSGSALGTEHIDPFDTRDLLDSVGRRLHWLDGHVKVDAATTEIPASRKRRGLLARRPEIYARPYAACADTVVHAEMLTGIPQLRDW
jgi:hypothetical protein